MGKKHNAKNTEVMYNSQAKQCAFKGTWQKPSLRSPLHFRRHLFAGSAVACCCFKKRSFPVHMGRMTQDDARAFSGSTMFKTPIPSIQGFKNYYAFSKEKTTTEDFFRISQMFQAAFLLELWRGNVLFLKNSSKCPKVEKD